MAEPAVLTKADLPEIIQRYRNGESLLTIAPETAVSWRQLYNWMYAETSDEARKDIQRECLISRHADACFALETAQDQLQLARAREQVKTTAWNLERRLPQLFAPKQEIKSDSRIQVIIQRETPQPVVVEGMTLEVQASDTQ